MLVKAVDTGARQTMAFALFTAALALVNVGVLRELVAYSQMNATDSHVILVPLVSAVLIFQDRRLIFASHRPALPLGAAMVAVGGLIALGALFLGQVLTPHGLLSVRVAGVVIAWIGGFVAVFGSTAGRAALFPLLFLAFTIPIPEPVVAGATQLLKSGSAIATASLFSITQTPYLREGYVFSLPSVVIEIADECSGIRSSIGLLLTTLLAGHTFLSRPWAKLVMIVAILPIAVLKNGIRIVTLTLLSIHVDPGFLSGQLHHEGGIVFFLLSLAILAPLLFVLRRYEIARPAGA